MLLHEARTADLGHKKKVRVGRGPGSGLGKTCGRGLKGATARSGWTMKVSYEGGQMPLFRRLPKRGFTNGPFRQAFAVVNVGDLGGFQAGSTIGPAELRAAGVVRGMAELPVKVLGDGALALALHLRADAFSKSALEKIQRAGGKAEWIGGEPKKPAPDFKKLEAEKKAKGAEKGKTKEGKEGKEGKKGEAGAPKGEGGKPAKPEAPKAPKTEGAKPPQAAGGKPPKAEGARAARSEAPKPAPAAEQKPPEQKPPEQ